MYTELSKFEPKNEILPLNQALLYTVLVRTKSRILSLEKICHTFEEKTIESVAFWQSLSSRSKIECTQQAHKNMLTKNTLSYCVRRAGTTFLRKTIETALRSAQLLLDLLRGLLL